jgi:photosystem II stability/assembly factor-like uncharacterized protein
LNNYLFRSTSVCIVLLALLVAAFCVGLPREAFARQADPPDFFWQNLLPQGNDLQDIAVVDSRTAIAVGDTGTILKTTDGGATWRTIPSGTTEVLSSITMGSAAGGWACGEGATLLRTVDGGETWEEQFPGIDGGYTGVSAVGADVAWLVGYDFLYGGAIIVKTTDGGENWDDQSPPGGGSMQGVSAVDARTAWAVQVGSGGFKTTDGGNTWTLIDTEARQLQNRVQGLSGTRAFLVGDGGQFMKTTNGTNWKRSIVPGAPDLKGLSFLDANTGWVVGANGFIAFTGDGGKTWSGEASNTTADVIGCRARSAGSVWACGSSGILFKKGAGGDWEHLSSGDTDGLFGITSIGERTAWASGFDGTILKTTDGGARWSPQSPGVTEDLFSISAADLSHAWAVGDGGVIVKTTDGGATWSRQRSGVGVRLGRVSAVDARTAWASGDGGVVVKTTDGGARWSRVKTGRSERLKIAAYDSMTAYCAVESSPHVLKTTDGGKNWSRQTLSATGYSVYTTDICVVDANTVFASAWVTEGKMPGNYGMVFKTNDGNRWKSTMKEMTRLTLFGVGTSDGKNVWACGLFGLVVRSTDGGKTWEEADSGARDKMLNAVEAVDGRVAWVVGLGGTILRTAAPVPYGIAPDSGLNTGLAAIADLAGNGFMPGMEVKLVKGGREILGENVEVISPYRATCAFDLRGVPEGAWDVVTTNTGGSPGRLREGFHVASGKTWYLAEGSTGGDGSGEFETWVLVQNPGKDEARATLTYLTPSGEVEGPAVTLAPESRCTVDVSATLPGEWDVATRIDADREIIAQRAMYWDTPAAARQASSGSIGTPFASRTWYLAEGSTGRGDYGSFETWILVQNPGEQDADIAVSYMTPGGVVKGPERTLPAGSRTSIRVSETVPDEYSVAAHVESGLPVVCERTVYWSTPATVWEEAHGSVGATGLAREWYLAEGSTGSDAAGSFETWVVVGNPSNVVATVSIWYQTPAGEVAGPTLVLNPFCRASFDVAESVPNDFSVSTKVVSDNPVAAERAVYWSGSGAARQAAQSSVGSMSARTTWDIAEGSTAQTGSGSFETWVLVQNPGGDAVDVRLQYMTPEGPVAGPRATLAPGSRTTFSVGDAVPDRWSVSTSIKASGPVAAEGVVYWSAPGMPRLSSQGSRGFGR